MQALFYMDMNHTDAALGMEYFCLLHRVPADCHDFFRTLVGGVMEHREEIDRIIERHSANWKISRMSAVDRNVIRMAVFEMRHCPEIPPKATINEAIDVGKKFGTEESGAFINGILDSIHLEMHPASPPSAGQGI